MRYVLSAYRGVEVRTASVSSAAQGVHMADTLQAGGYTISAVIDENGIRLRMLDLTAKAIVESSQGSGVGGEPLADT